MKTTFKQISKSNYDSRIVVVKDYISTDGSEQQLSYLFSPVDVWQHRDEFIIALDLFESDIKSADLMEIPVLFAKMLDRLNKLFPENLNLRPSFESQKWVLETNWNCEALMWEDTQNYYAVLWCTTA